MAKIAGYQMLINGDWVNASDNATFESVNPATGKVWSRIPEATAEDVDQAVRVADHTFQSGPWAAMSPIAEAGGFTNSGYGREAGFQAIYDYTRLKAVWMNTSSALHNHLNWTIE